MSQFNKREIMKTILVVFFVALTVVLPRAESQTRVYVHGAHGYRYVAGVDHGMPQLDGAGHDQTMELAKTFLSRCPSIGLTTNKDKADFDVQLNWTERTRFFFLGKIIHKPDQILVQNRDGDIIYSGVARSVGGNVEDACSAIKNASQVARTYQPTTTGAVSGTMTFPALGIMGTQDDAGVRIVSLASGGAAESANMHVGDVINSIDGKRVNSIMELASSLGSTARGVKVRIGYQFQTASNIPYQKEIEIISQ
jgi:PDZ domain